MPNFFTDNPDIKFNLESLGIEGVSRYCGK